MVSTPRISIGPAGSRINRDYARRGWATKTSHPNWRGREGREGGRKEVWKVRYSSLFLSRNEGQVVISGAQLPSPGPDLQGETYQSACVSICVCINLRVSIFAQPGRSPLESWVGPAHMGHDH